MLVAWLVAAVVFAAASTWPQLSRLACSASTIGASYPCSAKAAPSTFQKLTLSTTIAPFKAMQPSSLASGSARCYSAAPTAATWVTQESPRHQTPEQTRFQSSKKFMHLKAYICSNILRLNQFKHKTLLKYIVFLLCMLGYKANKLLTYSSM